MPIGGFAIRDWRWTPALVWAALSALIFITTAGIHLRGGVVGNFRLMNDGVAIEGTVTGLGPMNHSECRFAYIVGGVTHEATDLGCAHERSIGDPISVVYLRAEPDVATAGDPRRQFWEALVFLLGAPGLMALLVVVGQRRRLPARSPSSDP